MKSLKQILSEVQPLYYRFLVFSKDSNGNKKTVGMAYLKEGHSIYTLRLWTFLEDKFFLLPSKDDSARYLIMTREANKSDNPKKKYFWNIVGNAFADSSKGVVELSFDLFEKQIFMSIYPEESATPYGQPTPNDDLKAA